MRQSLLAILFLAVSLLAPALANAASNTAQPANPASVTLTPQQARDALSVLNDPARRAQVADTLRAVAAAGALAAPPAGRIGGNGCVIGRARERRVERAREVADEQRPRVANLASGGTLARADRRRLAPFDGRSARLWLGALVVARTHRHRRGPPAHRTRKLDRADFARARAAARIPVRAVPARATRADRGAWHRRCRRDAARARDRKSARRCARKPRPSAPAMKPRCTSRKRRPIRCAASVTRRVTGRCCSACPAHCCTRSCRSCRSRCSSPRRRSSSRSSSTTTRPKRVSRAH